MENISKHILNYSGYIKTIESLYNDEDYNIYNDITIQNLINEGLIKTYPVQKSIDIIKKKFPKLKFEIGEDGEIFIIGYVDNLKNYIPIFTNLGYFISTYTFNKINWTKEYDDTKDIMGVCLEAKYDTIIDPIPKILFHVSPLRFKDKIFKLGFTPKTKNRISNHPERIYLSTNLQALVSFGENMINDKIEDKNKHKKFDYNSGYCIYEINGVGIKNLYSDVNLRNAGFYSDHNISPKYIKLIHEHKFEK